MDFFLYLLMQICCITWLAWRRQSFIPLLKPNGASALPIPQGSLKDKNALKLISPKSIVELIKIGCNVPLFRKKNNAIKNHIQDKKMLILGNIDQISIRKDMLFFLRHSIPVLFKSHPNLHITIHGNTSSRDFISFIKKYNDRITHIKYVDNTLLDIVIEPFSTKDITIKNKGLLGGNLNIKVVFKNITLKDWKKISEKRRAKVIKLITKIYS
jgi:hypothetical protein